MTRWWGPTALVAASLLAAGSLEAQARAAAQASLAGAVRDDAGRPVIAAEVLINGEVRTRSDSTGRYLVEGIDAGEVTLLVRRFGYGPAEAQLRLAPGARRSVHIELIPFAQELAPVVVTSTGRGVLGMVQDTLGAPLRDVEVTVVGAEASVRTDGRGQFSMPDLAAGQYIVVVRREGYRGARFSLDVPESGSRQIAVELAPIPPGLSDANARAESGLARSLLAAERSFEHRILLRDANDATVITRATLDSISLGTLHSYLTSRGFVGGPTHSQRTLGSIPSAGGAPNGGREQAASTTPLGPCVFLDGELAPVGLSAANILLEEIELLEVHRRDYTQTLKRQADWAIPPRGCAVFVVVWFRR